MRLLRSVFAAGGFFMFAAPAYAQAQRVDSLPVALVEALLQPSGPGGSHQFVVGKLPPALERFLFVPGNARVLGGMSSFANMVVVIDVPSRPDEVIATYQREMPKLGWTLPPGPSRQWGFVPSAGSNSSGNGLEFCHIGQSIQIIPASNGSGGTRVTATVQNYGNQCDFARASAGGQGSVPPMPTLTNPSGSMMNVPGCSPQPFYPSGSTGTSERIQTTLGPDKLLEFFGRQLADSGWGSGENSASARRTWSKPENADTREVTLSANTIPGTKCVDVTMQVRTLVGPPRKP